jgi:heterodisulfide reductase subunit A-like polyferredoxin
MNETMEEAAVQDDHESVLKDEPMRKGVLVLGGGIAGIQSALDLADMGLKVYLVEKTPSLGGRMAQLDKTFPTNDCAMCTLSPKLVGAGGHPNIELLTYSDLINLEGKPGDYKATILEHPRYIDISKCVGCGECAKVCTVTLQNEFDRGLAERKATFIPFPQAVPLKYTIEKKGKSPCKLACPTKTNVQGYIALIRAGKFREALELIKKAHPFPGICGRVCTHPCEQNCKRGEVDQPLAVSALKRFIADLEVTYDDGPILPTPQAKKSQSIAIVGGGPAGLTAAYNLTLMGYHATVYEALPMLGGMLWIGIPPYRLPREVIRREIEGIVRLGVEIRLNAPIGERTKLEDLQKQYDAIFVAAGAHKPYKLSIFGEDLEGVYHGVTFMRKVNMNEHIELGDRVVVIGGGNTAMDCARSSVRLGAKEVYVLYRRTRNEMPVDPKEVEEAEEEGVIFHYLTSPTKILTDDGERASKIECMKMKLGEPDESGRRRPIPIQGSEFTIDVDIVIPAVSQSPDISFLPEEAQFEMTKWDRLAVNPTTLMTSTPGIFAGGDFVTGPSSVIEAIAAGERAAIAIDKYLSGVDSLEVAMKEEDLPDISDLVDTRGVGREDRKHAKKIDVEKRISSFDEVEMGFTEEEARLEAERCLSCGVCSECLECVKACEADAIDHDMMPKVTEVPVGSVIITTGFDLVDPKIKSEYGYDRFDNVITSLEFERILSASGPFAGKVLRPSDSEHPKKIAWIQCVCSRDEQIGKGYCSSVCCTYATKEAIIAKEHEPGLDCTIFYMDLRTFGKGFEEYYNKARNNYGVNYVRCRVPHVEEMADTKDLKIIYRDESGILHEEIFDMVVLSVGMEPGKDFAETAEKLKLDTNQYGFCDTEYFRPLETSKSGIFVAGALESPKDIPDTVAQASGAASKASAMVVSERSTTGAEDGYLPEIDVDEEPRIGVFCCHCGVNIGSVVDVPGLAEFAMTLPNVVFATDDLYTCSQSTQDKIKEAIKEHNLNRVIVASCTPRTHEPLFQKTIREAQLNPYLFELTSTREHCSWVHHDEHDKATEKAKHLVAMAVEKVARNKVVHKSPVECTNSALIIGGGPAGMTAALDLSHQGFTAYIIEKNGELGGNLRNIRHLVTDDDPQEELKELVKQVTIDPSIEVFNNSTLQDLSGYIGNFRATINQKGTNTELNVGAIIVATGAKELVPKGMYMYGEDGRVLTQLEFDKKLHEERFSANNIVMIQCVGSRDENRTYCSRVCCTEAVKNAIRMKELNPKANVFVLYRDVRTYGFREQYYRKAREKGVTFIRYHEDRKPVVEKDGKDLKVSVYNPVIGGDVTIKSDLVVLSAATVPYPENESLAQVLKVPLTSYDFFLEAHLKIKPVDFAAAGIFLCGTCHSPKFINETIAQASGAAARAATILSQKELYTEGIAAMVDEDRCAGCALCEENCPYAAIKVNEETGVAEVNEVLCMGCGGCSSVCPSNVPYLRQFEPAQLMAMVNKALEAA